MYKENLNYKRYFELEEIIDKGNLSVKEMEPLEQEQKNILLDQYKKYCEFVEKKFNEFASNYGKFEDWDIFCQTMQVRKNPKEITSVIIVWPREERDNGTFTKEYFEFKVDDKNVDLCSDELFDFEHCLDKRLYSTLNDRYLCNKMRLGYMIHQAEILSKYINNINILLKTENKLDSDKYNIYNLFEE